MPRKQQFNSSRAECSLKNAIETKRGVGGKFAKGQRVVQRFAPELYTIFVLVYVSVFVFVFVHFVAVVVVFVFIDIFMYVFVFVYILVLIYIHEGSRNGL